MDYNSLGERGEEGEGEGERERLAKQVCSVRTRETLEARAHTHADVAAV